MTANILGCSDAVIFYGLAESPCNVRGKTTVQHEGVKTVFNVLPRQQLLTLLLLQSCC